MNLTSRTPDAYGRKHLLALGCRQCLPAGELLFLLAAFLVVAAAFAPWAIAAALRISSE